VRWIPASDLHGRAVRDRNGKEVGRVQDIELDTSTWKARALVVSMRRATAEELGLDEPMVTGGWNVHVATDRIRAFGDPIVLEDTIWEVGKMHRERT